MPLFNLGKVTDNLAQIDPIFSFLVDSRNQQQVEGKEQLLLRLGEKEERLQRFIRSDITSGIDRDAIEQDDDAIEEYFQYIRRFKEELIVLVQIIGGVLSRAPELSSVQQQNSSQAQIRRRIYVDNRIVDFVLLYYKGFSKSQDVKVIYRFVPQEVGELVVYYLQLVLLFIRVLQREVRKQDVVGSQIQEPILKEQQYIDDEYNEYAEQ